MHSAQDQVSTSAGSGRFINGDATRDVGACIESHDPPVRTINLEEGEVISCSLACDMTNVRNPVVIVSTNSSCNVVRGSEERGGDISISSPSIQPGSLW